MSPLKPNILFPSKENSTVLSRLIKIPPFSTARIEKVKKSLHKKLAEINSKNIDEVRFEQELIYYLEKQDISEEQIRLDAHLNYFIETISAGSPIGKKLGFIGQEIGREINTIGSKSSDVKISNPNGLSEIDAELYQQINLAWEKETSIDNVSQGAYISSQQYSESLSSRLKLIAQFEQKAIWPPRQLNEDGTVINDPEVQLNRTCKIESWTKLSAAGAPSEFSIRAPLLDGISTVYVSFEEGTRGVFLLTDDQNKKPEIGLSGEIVVRKIYSQEGEIRYGTKVQLI